MPQQATRGIYLSSYLSPEGFARYLAISHDGRCVAWRTRYPFEDDADVLAELEEALNRDDPISLYP